MRHLGISLVVSIHSEVIIVKDRTKGRHMGCAMKHLRIPLIESIEDKLIYLLYDFKNYFPFVLATIILATYI